MITYRLRMILVTCALLMLGCSLATAGTESIKYGLCDVRVLYVFDDVDEIDWPMLYYINDTYGARVDLLTVRPRTTFRKTISEIKGCELYLQRYFLPDDSTALDSLMIDLYSGQRPDVVIYANSQLSPLATALKSRLATSNKIRSSFFTATKTYVLDQSESDEIDLRKTVTFNGRELLTRYRRRMDLEIPMLVPQFSSRDVKAGRLQRYRLIESTGIGNDPEASFLSGIEGFRLTEVIRQVFPSGPMRDTYLRLAKDYVSNLNASRFSVGVLQVDYIVRAYKAISELCQPPAIIGESYFTPEYEVYIGELSRISREIALDAVGVKWEGDIILKDSPRGPCLKFRIAISADGPRDITLSAISFHSYWDTTVVLLDATEHTILPHQSYLQEFVVDIDREYLESKGSDSLLFTAEINYGALPLQVSNSMTVWKAPEIDISFEPDFSFVPPVAGLKIDRVVEPAFSNVVITKPVDFSGLVNISLITPHGMFAGAYRQELQLDKGTRREQVRIPYSVSNLFELGIQYQTVSLLVDGHVVAADTARVRVASCRVADTIKIGFLPDTTGALEDILHMTNAGFEPLTNRTLTTGSLEAYDVLVIGSGSFIHYSSLRKIKDRLEDYVRLGGSIVVLAQPESWPDGMLPIAIVPGMESISSEELINKMPNARILRTPYKITEKGLLSSFYKKKDVYPFDVAPAEKVYETSSGGALLSVSRLGEGQIICCGFPLLDMVSQLNIEAIHLLANILNY